jgi:hypothetical protein
MKKKHFHQVKASAYYVFWGICTVAVVAGQIYIGSGYHRMSESFNNYVESLAK